MPTRHLLFALTLCRHSEFPAFLWLTSLSLRATSSSPHIAVVQPLDLTASASRVSGAVVSEEIRKRNFHAHGSDFTAQWVGFLHIARGGEGREKKRASARWGVCKAPTGASPRNPQTSAAQPSCICNPLQIEEFCRRDPCRCFKFA